MGAFILRSACMAALAAGSIASSPALSVAQASRVLLAAFAHPDDERVVGPLLSRLSREGWEVHLLIATDGSKGITDHGGIPVGPALAAAREKEAQCAANRLGVRQLHLAGLEDGGLASFTTLGRLRSAVDSLITRVRPVAIITFGPEGGTGHPDHRLVGNVVTQVIQADDAHQGIDVLYDSLPTERLRTAPPSAPRVNGMAESLLTLRMPFEDRDLVAGRESFACHRTQYTPAQMDAINKTLEHAWNGNAYLRPFTGTLRNRALFLRYGTIRAL
jgi:LmbE family N-acetylglucosaminyl deacetylase